MTKREFLTKVIEAGIDVELTEFATQELAKLDTTNARRDKVSKAAAANIPLLEKIEAEILDDEPKTASDVAAFLEVSVQKASALCRKLVAEGRARETEVKVPKKGKQKGFLSI